jgi:hypothetical protein
LYCPVHSFPFFARRAIGMLALTGTSLFRYVRYFSPKAP